jgi:hypothetical protein
MYCQQQKPLRTKAEVWRVYCSPSQQVLEQFNGNSSALFTPPVHQAYSKEHQGAQHTMSNSHQQSTDATSNYESTVPAHNFGIFGGGLLSEHLPGLSRNPSPGYIKRTISFLMHPPAQPTNPPVDFVIVNLDWARAIIGPKYFKPMKKDPERYYLKGLSGKLKKGRPGLKEKGLEFGLPYVYFMALCGERKVGCKEEELILSKEEWDDGKERREENHIEWRRLA